MSDAVPGATYGMLFVKGIVNDFDSLTSGVVCAEVDSLNEYNKFCVTMVKFPQEFYAQNISVRAYIKVNDEYTYSPNIVICNLYEKAVKLSSSNNYVESELIEEIINNTYVKFVAFTGMDTTLHSQMVSDFINDFNTYNDINVSIDEFFGNTYGKVTSSTLYVFFNTSSYAGKWKWMFNYINEVRVENGKDKLNENSYYAYFCADIHCFKNLCDPADINNYGVDFRNRDDYRYYLSGKAPYQLPTLELANRQDDGGTPYMLTAALPGTSWGTSTSRFDYTVLNKYLDYINVMTYGMFVKELTSHVSQLYKPSYAVVYGFSLDSAVTQFESLGFPANKLILGCAGYGTHFTITGEINDTAKYVGLGLAVTLSNAGVTGAHNSGTIYSHGIDILKSTGCYEEVHAYNTSGKFVGSYLINKTTKSFVTYDSIFSLNEKYKYVLQTKGLGLMCWSYTQDTNDTVINGIINAKNNN